MFGQTGRQAPNLNPCPPLADCVDETDRKSHLWGMVGFDLVYNAIYA
jgi:hypothetical protein